VCLLPLLRVLIAIGGLVVESVVKSHLRHGGHPACRFPDGYTFPGCVQSWRHPRCGRFRANGYVCCIWQPFQNLSRNLFLGGGFLSHPIQRVQWTSVALLPVTRRGVLVCTTPVPGPRAVVRCSHPPRWGQTKKMYYYYCYHLQHDGHLGAGGGGSHCRNAWFVLFGSNYVRPEIVDGL
jgi:hypothetical protein